MSGGAALGALASPARLPLHRRLALAGEIGLAYAHVRRLLRRGDVRSVIERLRAPAAAAAPAPADGYAAGLRLGRAVARVLARLPGDTRCLTMSLVLCALLARRGLYSKVVIAVRPGSAFGAHAWVELGGRPLLPAQDAGFGRLVEL